MSDFSDEYIDLISSDWSDSIDDADGYSYEMLIPSCHGSHEVDEDSCEDNDFQPVNCDFATDGEHCGKCSPDESELNYEDDFAHLHSIIHHELVNNDKTSEKQLKILNFIYNSPFSKKFRNGNGFVVRSGLQLKVGENDSIDILKWLEIEGIKPDKYVGGYIIFNKYNIDFSIEKIFFANPNVENIDTISKHQKFVTESNYYLENCLESDGIIFKPAYRIKGIDSSTERQIDILKWLKLSNHVMKFKNNNGFYVRRGKIVILKDGCAIDILEWLLKEGFGSSTRVLNYSVRHNMTNDKYPESIFFFEVK